MAAVRWTLGARDDLRSIVGFIARDSATYAAAVGGRIVAAADRLHRYPRSGRVVPEYETPDLREVIVSGYRVVYRVEADLIAILAVAHSRQDLVRRFGERLEETN